MGKEIKKNSFEESINRLEELVDKMESGESSLEQNLEWFEEGMDLIKTCQTHLVDADKRVKELIKPSKSEDKTKDSE
tara:strand:+ start:321 stop:551 length:231 start_codon:yes stop_codon:yes gene_type:complete